MSLFRRKPTHLHKWEATGVWHFIDTSFGVRMPRTMVLMRCEECGEIKKESVDGHWTLAQVNGKVLTEEKHDDRY